MCTYTIKQLLNVDCWSSWAGLGPLRAAAEAVISSDGQTSILEESNLKFKSQTFKNQIWPWPQIKSNRNKYKLVYIEY